MRTDTHQIYTAYEDYQNFDSADAEKNLMRAILRAAMDDIRKRGVAYRDARRYFLSGDEFYVYSFLNVCHHLELCPKTILQRLGLAEHFMPQDEAHRM